MAQGGEPSRPLLQGAGAEGAGRPRGAECAGQSAGEGRHQGAPGAQQRSDQHVCVRKGVEAGERIRGNKAWNLPRMIIVLFPPVRLENSQLEGTEFTSLVPSAYSNVPDSLGKNVSLSVTLFEFQT